MVVYVPTKRATAWGNAGGTCCPPADAAEKLTFDLKGGANLRHYSTQGSAPDNMFPKMEVVPDGPGLLNHKNSTAIKLVG